VESVCSFCGERPVVAWFEGPSFARGVDAPQQVTSEEAWLACATCLALVDADDRERLVERAVDRLATRGPRRPVGRETATAIARRHLDERFWTPRAS
jgi:hypothetical protein